VAAISLPVVRPTSVMFGGAGLRTLFITSMQHGLSPDELAAQPEAGCLFAAELDVPGLPEPRFAG
jgi:sugar lactone lactonase YvrE